MAERTLTLRGITTWFMNVTGLGPNLHSLSSPFTLVPFQSRCATSSLHVLSKITSLSRAAELFSYELEDECRNHSSYMGRDFAFNETPGTSILFPAVGSKNTSVNQGYQDLHKNFQLVFKKDIRSISSFVPLSEQNAFVEASPKQITKRCEKKEYFPPANPNEPCQKRQVQNGECSLAEELSVLTRCVLDADTKFGSDAEWKTQWRKRKPSSHKPPKPCSGTDAKVTARKHTKKEGKIKLHGTAFHNPFLVLNSIGEEEFQTPCPRRRRASTFANDAFDLSQKHDTRLILTHELGCSNSELLDETIQQSSLVLSGNYKEYHSEASEKTVSPRTTRSVTFDFPPTRNNLLAKSQHACLCVEKRPEYERVWSLASTPPATAGLRFEKHELATIGRVRVQLELIAPTGCKMTRRRVGKWLFSTRRRRYRFQGTRKSAVSNGRTKTSLLF